MNPTSHVFLPGHRIRLDVTSSDFPNYDRNHNTDRDPNADPTLAVADQTVFHGGAHASKLTLPWIPASDTAPAPRAR
jgi:predicted acyl esterase